MLSKPAVYWVPVIITCVVLALSGCCSEPAPPATIPTIDIELKNTTLLSLGHLLDASQLIPLELTDNSGLDYIHKVVAHDDRMYVFNEIEASYDKSLVIFNQEGHFLKRLSANTDGPGNFQFISDFFVHNDNLEIIDKIRKKIIRFDLAGNYIDEHGIDLQCDKVLGFNDGTHICFRANAYDYSDDKSIFNLVYFDGKGKKIEKEFVPFPPILKDRSFRISEFFFPSSEPDQYLYSDFFNDTIYLCRKDAVVPAFLLNPPNALDQRRKIETISKFPSQSQQFFSEFMSFINSPETFSKTELVADSKDGLFLSFKYRQLRYFYLHRPSGDQVLSFKFITQLFPIDSEYFFMIIWDPQTIKNDYNSFFENDRYRPVFDPFDDTSNPALLKVSIQKLFE